MYWIPYFWTILNFISWDGNIELSSWLQGKCFNMEMEFSFYIIKSFATWQKSRRNAFIRTKPDRTMKRRIPVIHSIKRTRSRMRLLARKRSKFSAFVRSVFPTILKPDTGLIIFEGILVSYGTGNILPTLFPKVAFGPSSRRFSLSSIP